MSRTPGAGRFWLLFRSPLKRPARAGTGRPCTPILRLRLLDMRRHGQRSYSTPIETVQGLDHYAWFMIVARHAAVRSLRFVSHLYYLLALLAVLWLTWYVRDVPLEPALFAGQLRVDSLSTFFALLTLLLALVQSVLSLRSVWPTLLLTLCLAGAYATSNLLLVAAGYLLATLIEVVGGRLPRSVPLAPRAIWLLLPVVCFAVAVAGLQTQAGTWHYQASLAGVGLSSFVFWFVLLATILGSAVHVYAHVLTSGITSGPHTYTLAGICLALAWCYPLVRLYSLGPWNAGWHAATLLLGGALALWTVCRALVAPITMRTHWLLSSQLGVALIGLGMGTSAGIVAGCYALMLVPLLLAGLAFPAPSQTQAVVPSPVTLSWALWLLSPALPLTAPFVSFWMGIGAAAAGRMFLLVGILWVTGLLCTLTIVQCPRPLLSAVPGRSGRTVVWVAGISVALGVTAPIVVWMFIRPIVQQLQGGLTPFGDIALWPWGGLIALNAARQPVATLPSLTLLLLMLVLGALAWLLLRLQSMMDNRCG